MGEMCGPCNKFPIDFHQSEIIKVEGKFINPLKFKQQLLKSSHGANSVAQWRLVIVCELRRGSRPMSMHLRQVEGINFR